MTFNPHIKFTVHDYMATSDDERYELIEGELLTPPSPTSEHQLTTKRLLKLLDDFVLENDLGEVWMAPFDVILSEHNVLQPDILFISKEHMAMVTDRVRGAPDLVIEVLSPGSEARDRVVKATVYARYGVREYCLVDPTVRTVEVRTLGQAGFERAGLYEPDGELQSSVLPGLRLPVRRILP